MDNLSTLRLAVLVPGCAQQRDDGVAVSGRLGPLVEGLAERVGTTTVLGYDVPENPRLEDRLDFVVRPRQGSVHVLSLGPKGSLRDYLSRRRRVRRIVAGHHEDWDVLFLPLVNRRAGLVYKSARGARVFAQIGGHTPSVVRSGPNRSLRHYLQLLAATMVERDYRRIARGSLFFVNGEALLPHYAGLGQGVEVVRTSARRAEHAYAAADRLAGNAPQFMLIGRMTVGKGVFEAIEAFAQLRATTTPNATLHVVGTGDAEPEMRRQAEERGVFDAIVWHGWVTPGPELFALYEQMDVLLTLSLAESLPKTVWEALAHSVLVIGTPVGAMPDVFVDGEDLLFVPPGDAQAAVDAVNRLRADPALRQRLIARGQETSAAASVEAVADTLLSKVTKRWPELA